MVANVKKVLALVGVLVVLAVLVWATAPALHWLWFGLFWKHPVGWCLIFVVIAANIVASSDSSGAWLFIAGVGGVVVLVTYAFYSSSITQYYLVRDVSVNEISVLPETSAVRYLPMEVAERYGRNKLQESSLRLGDFDPLQEEDEVNWVSPRVPSGFWNVWKNKADGFEVIKPDGSVEIVHQPMKFGEGMIITDNIHWQVLRRKYFVDLTEVYYLRINGEVVGILPYISYRFVFPVRVPYWGGVFVVHANGQIEDLTPEQAQADPRFTGKRLYPEAMALRIAKAWAYKHGISNAWFWHRDQTEVPEVEGAVNQMPYLLPTQNGPQWFVAAEPAGPAYGIFKMFFIDAHTGRLQLYELPSSSALTGPNKALTYVKAAFPNFGWYSKGEKGNTGNVIAIEPRPIFHGGHLFWQFSITTVDYAGVTRTVLVDAKTTKIRWFDDLDEFKGFLSGNFAGHVLSGAQEQAPSSKICDLSGLSEKELLGLMEKIVQELKNRYK